VEVAMYLATEPKPGQLSVMRQVVVDGLGHVDGLHRIAHLLRQLADLVAGIRRVAAAVVEEVADVVGLEDLDQALVLALVGLQALQLVAAGAEAAAGVWRSAAMPRRTPAGVDQVLGERADDAVAPGVDVCDLIGVLARRSR
jgi:hypothetical protein